MRPGVQVFAPLEGDAPAGTEGPTDTALIRELDRISAAGSTPTAATFRNIRSLLTSLPGKTYVIFATDGGPNCNPAAKCGADECQANMEDVSGCPPGGPPNCCSSTTPGGTPLACEDAAATVFCSAGGRCRGRPGLRHRRP